MVLKAVPGTQGPQAHRKGAWALRHSHQKTDVKYLQNVFFLTGYQPLAVNLRLRPMHTMYVHRHQTCGKFYSAV